MPEFHVFAGSEVVDIFPDTQTRVRYKPIQGVSKCQKIKRNRIQRNSRNLLDKIQGTVHFARARHLPGEKNRECVGYLVALLGREKAGVPLRDKGLNEIAVFTLWVSRTICVIYCATRGVSKNKISTVE